MTRDISRRAFVGSTLSQVVFLVSATQEGRLVADLLAQPDPQGFSPNQWITIAANGDITISAHKSGMGQGVRTALPAIVAAELGADWSRVTVRHAEPGPELGQRSSRLVRTSSNSSNSRPAGSSFSAPPTQNQGVQ